VTSRARALLGEERGQSLVFVALLLVSLVAVFGLVVDVGSWIRAQRQAQAVADAAALAGAQELPDQTAALQRRDEYAQLNWPGVDLSASPSPDSDSIEVRVRHDAPGLFSRLVGLLNVRVGADATARIEVPNELNAIAPLALECQSNCNPWSLSVQDYDFGFVDGDPDGSGLPFGVRPLGPVRLPGVGNSDSSFDQWVQCDPRTPDDDATCNPAPASTSTDYRRITSIDAGDLRDALQAVGSSSPRLVAVFDDYSSFNDDYHIVGWATAYVENVTYRPERRRRGRVVRPARTIVSIRFEPLLVTSSWMSDDGTGGNPNDFGVRAVGLVK
jgi:hypothetical protein